MPLPSLPPPDDAPAVEPVPLGESLPPGTVAEEPPHVTPSAWAPGRHDRRLEVAERGLRALRSGAVDKAQDILGWLDGGGRGPAPGDTLRGYGRA